MKKIGTDLKLIIKEAQKLIDDKTEYEKMSKVHNPYGDRKSCARISGFFE